MSASPVSRHVYRVFLAGILCGVLLPMCLGGALWFVRLQSEAEEQLRQRHAELIDDLAENMQEPLRFFQPDTAARQITLLAKDPIIYGVRVHSVLFDMDLARFSRVYPPGAAERPLFSARRHVFHGGEVLGFVELAFSSSFLRNRIRHLGMEVVMAMLCSYLFSVVVLYLLYRRQIVSPLLHLERQVDLMAEGDMAQPVGPLPSGEFAELFRRIEQLRSGLQKSRLQVDLMATRDPETNLLYREALFEKALRELELAGRYGVPLCMTLFAFDPSALSETSLPDIAHVGNKSERIRLAACLRRLLGPLQICGRWDDRLFIVIMPECTPADAVSATEDLRAAIAQEFSEAGLTCSFGVVAYGGGDTLMSMYGRAEGALCQAAEAGGNRVVRA